MMQQMGFAMAFAVLIDAVVIRCLAVPAAMSLLGSKAWWSPKSIDRLLPHLHVPGTPRMKLVALTMAIVLLVLLEIRQQGRVELLRMPYSLWRLIERGSTVELDQDCTRNESRRRSAVHALRRRCDESPTEKQRRVWDKSAPRYDRQMSLFEKIWLTGGREWIAERAQGRVLEVAIGTGRNLEFYRDDSTLTGIELSPVMLAIARRRAESLGRDVDLHEGDAAALPFAHGSFDTVVCALALCSIPDPERALSEMHRVLAPGGRLLLLDHVRSSWKPLYAAQWLVERLTIPLAGEYFTRRQRPLVEAVGLSIEESERLKAGTVERIAARKPVAARPEQ